MILPSKAVSAFPALSASALTASSAASATALSCLALIAFKVSVPAVASASEATWIKPLSVSEASLTLIFPASTSMFLPMVTPLIALAVAAVNDTFLFSFSSFFFLNV